MRRAVTLVAALAALAAAAMLPVHPARSQDTDAAIDGVGMVDYSKAPDFEVGSWVRYYTVVRGATGHFQEYWTTLVISGEEEFWGDRGFWLETITEDPGAHPKQVASLVSYDAFGDTAAVRQPTWFLRKTVRELDGAGRPIEMVQRRDANELRMRSSQRRRGELDPNRPDPLYDTLAVDTTIVPLGTWRGPLYREFRRLTEPRTTADSTIEIYRKETRVRRMGAGIPITSMAREDVEEEISSKHWKTGFSAQARERVIERAVARTMLVGFGKGNLPELVATPERARGKRLTPVRAKAAGAKPAGR